MQSYPSYDESETGQLVLEDLPDWGYLLSEIYWVYRHSSSGGSPPIRSHHRVVRERLRRVTSGNPPVCLATPESKPVCAHLDRALDNGKRTDMGPLVRCLEKIAPALAWQQGYRSMPGKLDRRYAYAEFLGPSGPVIADDLILGCVLFAPKTVYPTHAHAGITESYICLSGAMSQNDAAVYMPGSLILNTPDFDHKITSCALEPTLVTYAWVGSPEALQSYELVFSSRRSGNNRRPPGGRPAP